MIMIVNNNGNFDNHQLMITLNYNIKHIMIKWDTFGTFLFSLFVVWNNILCFSYKHKKGFCVTREESGESFDNSRFWVVMPWSSHLFLPWDYFTAMYFDIYSKNSPYWWNLWCRKMKKNLQLNAVNILMIRTTYYMYIFKKISLFEPRLYDSLRFFKIIRIVIL